MLLTIGDKWFPEPLKHCVKNSKETALNLFESFLTFNGIAKGPKENLQSIKTISSENLFERRSAYRRENDPATYQIITLSKAKSKSAIL